MLGEGVGAREAAVTFCSLLVHGRQIATGWRGLTGQGAVERLLFRVAPHVRSQCIPARMRHALSRAVVPLAGILCAATANMRVMDVLNEGVHVAEVAVAAVPSAHSDLLGVVKVVVTGRAGHGAGGVGRDVGEVCEVRGRVVVREEWGVV